MIAPFKISVETIQHFDDPNLKFTLENFKEKYYANLVKFVRGENNILDGTKLQQTCFPAFGEYDVFISHSHNDERAAMCLAYILAHMGIRCFVDGCLWGSADALLKEIDDDYSWTDASRTLYSYPKRNYSTSHVHAMLSIALLEAINNSHFFIFIDSNNSINLKEGVENQTLSPWIYEELAFANRIQRENPRLIERYFSGGVINEAQQLVVSYDIKEYANFKSIYSADIEKWGKMSKTDIFNSLIQKYQQPSPFPNFRPKLL